MNTNRQAIAAAIAADHQTGAQASEGSTANRKPSKKNRQAIQADFAKLRQDMGLTPRPDIDQRLAKAKFEDLPEVI